MPKKIREEDMSKALFPDRGKGPDPAMPKTDFARALPVILKHQEEILKRPEWFFCTFGECYFHGMLSPVNEPASIGHLLLAWKNHILTEPCDCGGSRLIFSASGSPLSGSNSYRGWCRDCGIRHGRVTGYLRKILKPIGDLLRAHRKPADIVIRETLPDRFCWSKGLIKGTPGLSFPVLVPVQPGELLAILEAGTH